MTASMPPESKPPMPTHAPAEGKQGPQVPSRAQAWSPWRAVSTAAFLSLFGWCMAQHPSGNAPRVVAEQGPRSGTESKGSKEDAEPVGLGDDLASAPATVAPVEPARSGIGKALPDKPFPGQRLPPCEKPEIEINRGCWVHWVDMSPPCGDRFYAWKGKCYSPILEPQRAPTSEQP